MGDNKKWFKVWNSILTDPGFLDLPLEQIGRWVLLGALISLHGENGKITLSRESLFSLLRIKNIASNDNGLMFPNISIDATLDANGSVTVIMKNWLKYQLDSTGYERLKKWREAHHDNGVREDKEKIKRREDKERKKEPPLPPQLVDNSKLQKEPFKPNCTEEQRHKIEQLTLKLTPYWRTCQKWIKDNIRNAHPEAIIKALNVIDEHRPTNPYDYAQKIISVESGNLREQDFITKQKGVNFEELVNKLGRLK